MNIGRVGIPNTIASGGILTTVLNIGIDVFEYILDDHVTLSMLTDCRVYANIEYLNAGTGNHELGSIILGPLITDQRSDSVSHC